MVKAYNKNILFHVDAVQGFGKVSHLPEAPEVWICVPSVDIRFMDQKESGVLYIDSNM